MSRPPLLSVRLVSMYFLLTWTPDALWEPRNAPIVLNRISAIQPQLLHFRKNKFVLESLRFSPANYATSASIAGYARTLDYAGISESRQPWTDSVRAALPRSKDRGHESPSRPKSREHLNAGPPPGGSLELGSIYGIQAL